MPFFNDLEDIWDQVKIDLKDELTPSIHDLWFGPVDLHSYDEENATIVFATISEFNYKVISKRYIPLLKKHFAAQLGFELDVKVIFTGEPSVQKINRQFGFSIKTDEEIEAEKKAAEEKEKEEQKAQNTLPGGVLPIDYNFQYTFENFIVGGSNKFAHAACMAIATHPQSSYNYNPLFIYGQSGLGKTHLMSAIVNEITKNNPRAKVIYIKGEEFTNQLIESLAKKEMQKFHDKYRNCDILLIDDIQFIAGKTSTQEEFFHTFNALYESHKQIVLSSDRPPKDIQPLEDRLKSRFESGLIADIQPPDLELRIAIIKKKAEQVGITLTDDVLTFLAENLRSNIRQIEGTVKKLSATVFLEGKEITMEIAAACLREITGGIVPTQVVVDKIFSAVYNKYGVPKADILSQKRNKEIAMARHISIYLIRQLADMSSKGVGKIFNRDHSTIIASCEIVVKRMNTDPLFNAEINEISKEISSAI